MGPTKRRAPENLPRLRERSPASLLGLMMLLLALGASGCFSFDEFTTPEPEGMGCAQVPFPQGEYSIPPTNGAATQVQTLACITRMSDPLKCGPNDPSSCAMGCKFQIFSDEDPFGGLALQPIDTTHFVPWGQAIDTTVTMNAGSQGLVKDDIPINLLHVNCLNDTCLPREIARVSVSNN